MEQLENKIREILPRLKEISTGLNFIDELGFKARIVYINNGTYFYFSESDNEVLSVNSLFFHTICKETIGHDIKLNDVLEWLNIINDCGFLMFSDGCLCKFDEEFNDYYPIDNKTFELRAVNSVNTLHWDLSSVFLADQSEELKEFLNSL